jgi:hypothetical protein
MGIREKVALMNKLAKQRLITILLILVPLELCLWCLRPISFALGKEIAYYSLLIYLGVSSVILSLVLFPKSAANYVSNAIDSHPV